MYNVYLVEDEENLNNILKSYLKNEEWNVKTFFKGLDALKCIKENPHIWILDIMLPDIDGYQLIKEIKSYDDKTPVIFISARDADMDKIIGLEMGSDDYLAKPFLPKELVIRTKKLLNRVYGSKESKEEKIYMIGEYSINKIKRSVMDDTLKIELTSKEFDLLMMFSEKLTKAFSREEILNNIWGEGYFGSDRVVDDLIRRVRKKLPKVKIETIYGVGYRMGV